LEAVRRSSRHPRLAFRQIRVVSLRQTSSSLLRVPKRTCSSFGFVFLDLLASPPKSGQKSPFAKCVST
jgi:hypothetical protein